jgi:hypothetical protein
MLAYFYPLFKNLTSFFNILLYYYATYFKYNSNDVKNFITIEMIYCKLIHNKFKDTKNFIIIFTIIELALCLSTWYLA